jgi:hypothetical protein
MVHAAAMVYATTTVYATTMVYAAAMVYATAIYATAVSDRGISRYVGPAASIGTPVKSRATSSRDQCHIGALVRNRRY